MARNFPVGAGSVLENTHISEKLDDMGVDPIEFLAEVVRGDYEAATITERVACAKELASYIHPKKKAEDRSKPSSEGVTFNLVNFADVAPERALELREAALKILEQSEPTNQNMKRILSQDETMTGVMVQAMSRDIEVLQFDTETGLPSE